MILKGGSYVGGELIVATTLGVGGGIGIGTSNPSSLLELSGVTPTITLSTPTNSNPEIKSTYSTNTNWGFGLKYDVSNALFTVTNNYPGDATYGDIRFRRNTGTLVTPVFTETMTLDGRGYVGIGVVNPVDKLTINVGTNQNLGITSSSSITHIRSLNDANDTYVPLNFLASKYSFVSGNVGIGTDATYGTMSIRNTGYLTALEFNTSATIGSILSFDRTNSAYRELEFRGEIFTFSPSDVQKVRILNNGNVGIGTITPGTKLDVYTTTSSEARIRSYDNSTTGFGSIETKANNTAEGMLRTYGSALSGSAFGVVLANYTALFSTGADSNGLTIGTITAKPLILGTNNSESMRILSGGNVGIGTTSPGTTLPTSFTSTNSTILELRSKANLGDVGIFIRDNDGSPGVDIWADNDVGQAIIDSRWNSAGHEAGFLFRTRTAGTPVDALKISGSGNVGIGTTSPIVKLHTLGLANGLPATSGTAQTNATLRLGNVGTGGILDIGQSTAISWLQATNSGDLSQNYTIALNPNGGNVGINITAPTNQLTQKTTALLEAPAMGAELVDATGWTTTGWTGSYALGWTHTVGNTTSLIKTIAATTSTLCKIVFTVTGNTNMGFGGVRFRGTDTSCFFDEAQTYTYYTFDVPGTTGTLEFVLDDDQFNGTISGVSVVEIGQTYNAVYAIQDSTGVTAFEIRSPLNSLANTFLGKNAGSHNLWGYSNTAVGNGALTLTTTGYNNVAFGANSLYSNSSGIQNIAIGTGSLYTNTANNNIAVGWNALYYNAGGSSNIAMGSGTLSANTSGSQNLAIGESALSHNTTAESNIAIGHSALLTNITGHHNIAIGTPALTANTIGLANIAIGHDSLVANVDGHYNTAIGRNAIGVNVSGSNNTGVGYCVLQNSTVDGNTAMGYYAAYATTTGTNNTIIGHAALSTNTTGGYNVAVGRRAGSYISTGSFVSNALSTTSIYIGADTKSFASGDTNEVVIGFEAVGVGSNSVVLGNNSIVTTVLKGNVGVATTTPRAKLEVISNDAWNSGIAATMYSATVTRGADIVGYRSRGTSTALTTVASGDVTAAFRGAGYDGAGFFMSAGFRAIVDGTVSTGVVPQAFSIITGTNSNPTERMRVTSAGLVGIGTATPQHIAQIYGTLKVGGAANQQTGVIALGDDASTLTQVGMYRGTITGGMGTGDVLVLGGYSGITLTSSTTGFGSQTVQMTIPPSGAITLPASIGSSSTFASGFAGSGWRVDYGVSTASKATAEFDNLTVRGSMRVYETLINQVRASNGSIFVSSTGKILTAAYVSGGLGADQSIYTFTTDANTNHGFAVNDLIRAQRVTGTGTYLINLQVTVYTSTTAFTAKLIGTNAYIDAAAKFVGMEFVRLGSTSDTSRQGSVYMTADDSYAPFIDIVDGIAAHTDWNTSGKIKARLGKLTGITSPTMGALTGYGLWSDNVYLEGNANIVGTLAVGGGNTIGNTFYVGKIKTNLLLYSQDISQGTGGNIWNRNMFSSWYANNTSVTPNFATAPDGTNTACKFTNPRTAYEYVWQRVAVTANQTYTVSCWFKNINALNNCIKIATGNGNTLVTYNTDSSYTTVSEWTRKSVSITIPASGVDNIEVGVGGCYIINTSLLIWGVQVETGTVVTPYQKTDGIISSSTGYGVWGTAGGFGGTIQNPVVTLGDYGIKVNGVGTSTALTNASIMIGNITGAANSAIKIANTGTAGTSGLFGYDSAGANVFKLALDGTNQIGGWTIGSNYISGPSMEMISGTYPYIAFYDQGNGNDYVTIGRRLWDGAWHDDWNGAIFRYNSQNWFQMYSSGDGATRVAQIAGWNFNAYAIHKTASSKTLALYQDSGGSALVINDGSTYGSTGVKRITFGNALSNNFAWEAKFGVRAVDASNNELFFLSADGNTSQIAGWNFDNSKLYTGSGSSFVGVTSGSTSFFAGATTSTGTSAKFSVTSAGALTSTSGSIAGWLLNSGQIISRTETGGVGTTLRIRSSSSVVGGNIYQDNVTTLQGFGVQWFQSLNAGYLNVGSVLVNSSGVPELAGTGAANWYGIQAMYWDAATPMFQLAFNANLSGSKAYYNSIAGWRFDMDAIYTGTKVTIAGYSAAAGDLTISKTIGISANKFYLDLSGNAYFKGELSAPTGSIGGFTIGAISIYNGKATLTGTGAGIYIGTTGISMSAAAVAPTAYWTPSKFALGVNASDITETTYTGLYMDGTGAFRVGTATGAATPSYLRTTAAGVIDITSGNLKISGNTTSSYIKMGTLADATTVATTNTGMYADNNGNFLVKGNTSGTNYLKVTYNGGIDINSSSFTLTGAATLKLSNTYLAFGPIAFPTGATAGTGIFLDASGLYGVASNVTKFTLNATTGVITATGASISGDITADTGHIGGATNGWDITTNKITSGTASLGISFNYSSTAFITGSGFEIWDVADPRLFIGKKGGSRLTWNVDADATDQLAIYSGSTPVKVFETTAAGATIGGWSLDASKLYNTGYVGVISTTGTVGSITGSGPWTATITGVSSTTNLTIGDTISATAGTGTLYGGSPTSCVVASFVANTSITYTVTGGTTPTAGTVTNVTTVARYTGLQTGSGSTKAFFAGATASTGTNAKIYLNADGTGGLASGNIAWDVSGNTTFAGNITSNATITGGTIQTAASGQRVVLGTSGIKGYDSTATPVQRYELSNTGSGWLGATDKIAWTVGGVTTIGGFTLAANDLYSGSTTTRVQMSSSATTGGFWAGADARGSAPFSVTQEGALVASKIQSATIAGTINNTTGNISILSGNAGTSHYEGIFIANSAANNVLTPPANAIGTKLGYYSSGQCFVIDTRKCITAGEWSDSYSHSATAFFRNDSTYSSVALSSTYGAQIAQLRVLANNTSTVSQVILIGQGLSSATTNDEVMAIWEVTAGAANKGSFYPQTALGAVTADLGTVSRPWATVNADKNVIKEEYYDSTNGRGYVKYSDGTLMNYGYSESSTTITFPCSFSTTSPLDSKYSFTANIIKTVNDYTFSINIVTRTATQITVVKRFSNGLSTGAATEPASYVAIGRWK